MFGRSAGPLRRDAATVWTETQDRRTETEDRRRDSARMAGYLAITLSLGTTARHYSLGVSQERPQASEVRWLNAEGKTIPGMDEFRISG